MTLVNRVSIFFLVALATVLALYSLTFYAVYRQQLYRQFDEQLHGALAMLAAAVEVEEDGAKWQPDEHAISLEARDGLEEVRWAVFDETGALVDHSQNMAPQVADDAQFLDFAKTMQPTHQATLRSGNWRFLQERVVAPQPKPRHKRDSDEFNELIITVARSQAELDANLGRLAFWVSVLPVGAWLVAAALGRWFCARAIRPVLQMAERARSMTGADFRTRLPIAHSGDELADLGGAFNVLLDRLQQTYEQQRRFTGDAAHQLRTPLTVLLGQVDVALLRPRPEAEYRRALGVLREQTLELQQMVESLLFLARSDEDAVLPGTGRIDLAEWLPEYLQKWSGHPRRNDLQLDVKTHAAVTASTSLLAQLLDNLVANALKYSEEFSPVTVHVERRENEVAIAVNDEGRGIAAEERKAIFEPFFRSAEARQSGIAGTGLGLAIAARIAQALRGRLTCESELGRGSTFTLHLPAEFGNELNGLFLPQLTCHSFADVEKPNDD